MVRGVCVVLCCVVCLCLCMYTCVCVCWNRLGILRDRYTQSGTVVSFLR
jgi:hypothetical protein